MICFQEMCSSVYPEIYGGAPPAAPWCSGVHLLGNSRILSPVSKFLSEIFLDFFAFSCYTCSNITMFSLYHAVYYILCPFKISKCAGRKM